MGCGARQLALLALLNVVLLVGGKLNVVLLVGGRGERFQHAGWRIPKALLPVPVRAQNNCDPQAADGGEGDGISSGGGNCTGSGDGNGTTKPMLLWVLDSLRLSRSKHEVIVVYHSSLRAHGFVRIVREHWLSKARRGGSNNTSSLPRLLLHAVSYRTRGAAETALSLLNALPTATLRRPTLTLDCDVGYYGSDILAQYEAALLSSPIAGTGAGAGVGSSLPGMNALFYTVNTQPEPKFSYLQLAGRAANHAPCRPAPTSSRSSSGGFCGGARPVLDVLEKQKISDYAATGAYAFASGHVMRDAAEAVVGDMSGVGLQKGEFYISSLFRYLLRSGSSGAGNGAGSAGAATSAEASTVWALQVPAAAIDNLGTPAQLAEYAARAGLAVPMPPQDGSSASDGARCSLQGNAMPPAALVVAASAAAAADASATGSTVARAQVWIDYTVADHEPPGEVSVAEEAVAVTAAPQDEFVGCDVIPPRQLNSVVMNESAVTKSSASAPETEGQLWFYGELKRRCGGESMSPQSVRACALFPRLLGFAVGGGSMVGPLSITTERVHGPTFSHLFVNSALLGSHLRALLGGLRELHDLAPPPAAQNDTPAASAIEAAGAQLQCREGACAVVGGSEDERHLYANYARKVEARFRKHREREYAELDVKVTAACGGDGDGGGGGDSCPLGASAAPGSATTAALLALLLPFLARYEAEQRGVPTAGLLHGDPVFTNTLLVPSTDLHTDRGLRLVDMRGRLLDCCSARGDALYDYAKVLQSLAGYDHVLHDRAELIEDEEGERRQPAHATYAAQLRGALRQEVLGLFRGCGGGGGAKLMAERGKPRRGGRGEGHGGGGTTDYCRRCRAASASAGRAVSAGECGAEAWRDVQRLAASLAFSLLPLHEHAGHRWGFFRLAWRLWVTADAPPPAT